MQQVRSLHSIFLEATEFEFAILAHFDNLMLVILGRFPSDAFSLAVFETKAELALIECAILE